MDEKEDVDVGIRSQNPSLMGVLIAKTKHNEHNVPQESLQAPLFFRRFDQTQPIKTLILDTYTRISANQIANLTEASQNPARIEPFHRVILIIEQVLALARAHDVILPRQVILNR